VNGLLPETRHRRRQPKVEARLQAVELELVKGRRYAQIVRMLEGEHGLSRSSAERYLSCAIERMRRESCGVDRAAWRARLEAIALEGIEAARNRKKAVTKGVGVGLQEVEYIDDPDVAGIERLARLLGNMTGLIEGRGGVTINNNTQVNVVPENAAKAILIALTGGPAAPEKSAPIDATPPALAAENGAQALSEITSAAREVGP
jgi:hypothetical protein